MKIKRKCFTVFLIIVLVIQDPFMLRANELLEGNSIWGYSQLQLAGAPLIKNKGEINSSRILYYLNGGTNAKENPSFFQEENLPFILYTPVRKGYNFAGWYEDSNFKTKISRIEDTEKNVYTLYAKWNRVIDDEYNIQMYSYQSSTTIGSADKELKECEYSLLQEVSVPGMPSTREEDVVLDRITDTSQCPQGICFTDDYLLVSAYSSRGSGNLGCLHVFDKKTGEYLVTLGMKKQSHLGGVTFDGKNIWICHSDNNTLECVPYVFVKRIASNKPQSVVDCSALFNEFHISNSPSCITYYEGKLWVATHTKFFNSIMISYRMTDHGLRQDAAYKIPDKVQGIAFDKKGKVYLSTSYGRKKSSYIKVYSSISKMDKKPGKPQFKLEMPPCSEEIEISGGNLYVLFESAGEKYLEGTDGKGKSVSPIEKILSIPINSIKK